MKNENYTNLVTKENAYCRCKYSAGQREKERVKSIYVPTTILNMQDGTMGVWPSKT